MNNEYYPTPVKREKLIAALLAFFLGSFGIHHFYLGNKGRGTLFIMLFWTLIPGLLAFIKGIFLLLMSQEEFDYKYNLAFIDTKHQRQMDNTSYASYNQAEKYKIPNEKISIADEIEKLHNLMVKGIISEQEFVERKKRL